jgi:four helix bundle protein
MLKDFRAYQVSIQFYQRCKTFPVPLFLKDQLLRASSSVAMNLAEGSGKLSPKEQRRFYSISFGSLRECQAIFEMERIQDDELLALADKLGAMLFKLCRITPRAKIASNAPLRSNEAGNEPTH